MNHSKRRLGFVSEALRGADLTAAVASWNNGDAYRDGSLRALLDAGLVEHQVWPSRRGWVPTPAGVRAGLKMDHLNEARAPRVVRDFNTLDDLIAHARDELGATHVLVADANTKLYFPRGGQYSYEEASVWRKSGYWHAQGPSARTGVEELPEEVQEIGGGRREGRRAAEARRGAPLVDAKLYTVTWAGGRQGNLTDREAVDLVRQLRNDWVQNGRRGTLNIQVWYRDGSLVPYADLERSVGGGGVEEDRRRGPRGEAQRRLTRSTARPGMHVRVVDGDSMYRGEVGTIVVLDARRANKLDDFNRRFLKGEGTVLVERRDGSLFVIHARALERENENPIDKRAKLRGRS